MSQQRKAVGLAGAVILLGLACSPTLAAERLMVVAVGGSNTYGEGVSRADTYPAQLEALLRRDGLDVTVRNEGINGQTTAEMLLRLRLTVPEGTHIVILQVGGNDLRPGEETNTNVNVETMVATLRERHIEVLIIPGAGLRGPELRELADKYDTLVAPPFARMAPDQRVGQHFTPLGYRMIAERVAPLVKTLATVHAR